MMLFLRGPRWQGSRFHWIVKARHMVAITAPGTADTDYFLQWGEHSHLLNEGNTAVDRIPQSKFVFVVICGNLQ